MHKNHLHIHTNQSHIHTSTHKVSVYMVIYTRRSLCSALSPFLLGPSLWNKDLSLKGGKGVLFFFLLRPPVKLLAPGQGTVVVVVFLVNTYSCS